MDAGIGRPDLESTKQAKYRRGKLQKQIPDNMEGVPDTLQHVVRGPDKRSKKEMQKINEKKKELNRINTIIIINKLFIFTKSFHIYNKLLELIEDRNVRSKEEWCLDIPSPWKGVQSNGKR